MVQHASEKNQLTYSVNVVIIFYIKFKTWLDWTKKLLENGETKFFKNRWVFKYILKYSHKFSIWKKPLKILVTVQMYFLSLLSKWNIRKQVINAYLENSFNSDTKVTWNRKQHDLFSSTTKERWPWGTTKQSCISESSEHLW